jgi:DNA-binding MarR family transcriptional regulator
LTIAARRHRTRTAALLNDIGLFPGQEQVLKLLTGGDGRTMSAMAEALAIRPPTASKMIARLSAQGLVERRASQEDARIVSVYLTDEGRRRATALDAIAAKTEDELLDGLDNKDRRRLRKLLRKISKNLMVVEDAADAPDEEEPDED